MARIESLRESPAYKHYLRVREWVVKMRDMGSRADSAAPSEYWEEELEALDFMFDASPLVVDKLRRHTYPVTGIRAYDYRTHKDEASRRLAEKLDALVELGGPDLLVPESPVLGGFGFEIDGDLYNVDTLKYYEALIAMNRGGVLDLFRDGQGRRLVLEVGPGWGGFPYQFKRLFPDTTYVLVDLPELFLFSATYLLSALPDARVAFYSRKLLDEPESLLEADLVFIPNSAMAELTLPRLDLMTNMVSFQEMTEEQVAEYVGFAHEAACPYVYSLNRERSLYNPELTGVSEILGRHYEPREIHVLDVSYLKMLDKAKPPKGKQGGKALDYRHLVGEHRVPR